MIRYTDTGSVVLTGSQRTPLLRSCRRHSRIQWLFVSELHSAETQTRLVSPSIGIMDDFGNLVGRRSAELILPLRDGAGMMDMDVRNA